MLFTFRNDIQRAGVQYIIDSVVESLLKDPSRRLNFRIFNIFICKAGSIHLSSYISIQGRKLSVLILISTKLLNSINTHNHGNKVKLSKKLLPCVYL